MPYLEPDLDGTRESEVSWCGWPDGGAGEQARSRGWGPEVGSEEEVAFLAAVMVKETEGIDMNDLDYGVGSHILLGVMCSALDVNKGQRVEEVKCQLVAAGRINESKAKQWIREVLMVMEPYLRMKDRQSDFEENRGKLLRQILVENGQLLARWKLSNSSKELSFDLQSKE